MPLELVRNAVSVICVLIGTLSPCAPVAPTLRESSDQILLRQYQELNRLGFQLLKALQVRDESLFLQLLCTSPGVGFGPELSDPKTCAEIKEQFERRTGLIFCLLFESGCLRKSLREHAVRPDLADSESLAHMIETRRPFLVVKVEPSESGEGVSAHGVVEFRSRWGFGSFEFHCSWKDKGPWQIVGISLGY